MSIEQRIANRTFPSVFQAWSPADNLKGEPRLTTLARHDLVFSGPQFFGLKWEGAYDGLATGFAPESIQAGLAFRRNILERNPVTIMLAEIRYRDARNTWMPQDHPWWRRKDGRIVAGWEEGGFLQIDYSNPEYRLHVAAQCRAVMDTGVVDGVMLDWWKEDDDRLELVKTIREEIGPDSLVLVNANDRKSPRTAPYINGYFMECTKNQTPEHWARIADTYAWANEKLRQPRQVCLETWFHQSRQDIHLMRATTTLALTLGDGYCLFSDPNPLPTPDHLHDWYTFWDKGLGKPKGPSQKRDDGAFIREFDNGFAIYNPAGNNEETIRLKRPLLSRATGREADVHIIAAFDGDILIRP